MRTSILIAGQSSSSGSGVTRSGPVGDHDPAAGEVDLGDQRLHERHQRVAAVGGADRQQVLGTAVDQAGDLAEVRHRRGRTPPARSAGGRRTRRGPRGSRRPGRWRAARSRGPPRRRCGRRSPRRGPAAWTGATGSVARSATRSVVADPRGGSAPQRHARREPAVRLVGADVDGHLAAQAVRLADPADDDVDGLRSRRSGLLETTSPPEMQNGCRPGGTTPIQALLLSDDGRRRRSRPARRRGRRVPRRRCGTRWPYDRRDRSPCRGRRGAPGPRGSSRDAAACRARVTSSGLSTTPRTRCSSASASMSDSGLRLLGALGGLGLLGRDLGGLVGGTGAGASSAGLLGLGRLGGLGASSPWRACLGLLLAGFGSSALSAFFESFLVIASALGVAVRPP